MLGRVTKYRVNNDAPSEVFEAASEQERKVRRCSQQAVHAIDGVRGQRYCR